MPEIMALARVVLWQAKCQVVGVAKGQKEAKANESI
jgi:hypothetical protein